MQIPTFAHEKRFWDEGISLVAGIDEAGMGALAGPVMAAAVVFDQTLDLTDDVLIRDSKTLTEKRREAAAVWIREHAFAWAVGEASVAEITELNIRGASQLAMRRAITALRHQPHLLLIDGTPAQLHPEIPAVNIIDGDALSLSIAAASILAKVHRDRRMIELDAAYPVYGLASHKGYGSTAHKTALDEHGPCEHHRPTYAPVAAAFDNMPKVR